MSVRVYVRRLFVGVIIAVCAAPAAFLNVQADTRPVTVQIGQPSLWSLGQAHYLLANMHQENRQLKVPMPTTELNPNSVNGARLDFLRSAFSAEVQYSGPAALQNRLNEARYSADMTRKTNLRAQLDARREQLAAVNRELVDLKLVAADLQGELAALGPEAAAADAAKRSRAAQLTGQIEAKTLQKTVITEEVTALSAQEAAITLTTPTFTAPSPGAAMPADSVTPLLAKALDKMSDPSLSASMVLDNFVQMQYEVIAKQLTLLRDEVGPDEQILFVELPASFYTIPGKADDYLVRMQWEVSEVYETDLSSCSGAALDAAAAGNKGGSQAQPARVGITPGMLSDQRSHELFAALGSMCGPTDEPRTGGWVDADGRARAVDIIPRQSALNVNDHHATQRSFSLAALAQLVTGIGAKVAYERQRTIYEQFMHQDVFAAGFGKGQQKFGWTFGPVPGTKRLAPGVRNTYAVVVVPKNTLGVRFNAIATPYKRKHDPDDSKYVPLQTTKAFEMLVPRELTRGYWIDSIAYTPVPRGQRVVALLEGAHISPQAAVLVNGVPLRRAVAIGRHESTATSAAAPALGVDGEYEYLGATSMILSFSMGDAYAGTPLIVLVTPDKVGTINSLELGINYKPGKRKLYEVAATEPMFIEPFEVKNVIREATGLRIVGTGFRPDATILVDGAAPPIAQTSTQEYIVTLPEVPAEAIAVTMSQQTRQGLEARSFELAAKPARTSSYKVLDIRPAAPPIAHRLVLQLSIPGTGAVAIDPSPDYQIDSVDVEPNAARVVVRVRRDDVLLNATRDGKAHTFTINAPVAPTITRIDNLATGKPSAPAGEETLIRLRGRHLHRVTRVFFGDQEAAIVNIDASGDVLLVRSPKGNTGRVAVHVETPLTYQGRPVTNARDFISEAVSPMFTFLKPAGR